MTINHSVDNTTMWIGFILLLLLLFGVMQLCITMVLARHGDRLKKLEEKKT